jgi:hypothetical protein
VRVELDRVREVREGFAKLAFIIPPDAALVISSCVARTDFDGPLKVLKRLIDLSSVSMRLAAVTVELRSSGAQRNRLIKISERSN